MAPYSAEIWLSQPRSGYAKVGTEGTALFEFCAFWLDPMMLPADSARWLRDTVLPHLRAHFEPFVEHYPFLGEPLTLQIQQDHGETFIYGAQECPDLVDFDLLCALLWQVAAHYGDLHLHISDEDYLVCRHYDTLPPWLSPAVLHNRVWLQGLRVVAIPTAHLHAGLPLELAEAVGFLRKNGFQCPTLVEVGEGLARRAEEWPQSLAGVVDVTLRLTPEQAATLAHHAWVASAALMRGLESSASSAAPLGREAAVAVPDWLAEVGSGADLLAALARGWPDRAAPLPATETADLSRLALQRSLKAHGRLAEFVPPRAFAPTPATATAEEERAGDMMKRVEAFLKEPPEDWSEEDEGERSDGEPDIDEDDFFEFFLTEALRVTDLEPYRAGASADGAYNDDSDYTSD